MTIQGIRFGRVALLVILCASLAAATRASAITILGGGKKKTACYSGFEVTAKTNAVGVGVTKTAVRQRACDGSCTFAVSLCVNETGPRCTPEPVTGFTFRKGGDLPLPELGGTERACGPQMDIEVPLRNGRRKAATVFKIIAATAGKPDRNKLKLICLPNKTNAGCGEATCDLTGCPLSGGSCAPNPDGGPDQATFTVLGEGTDLDNGWSGTSHNFPVIKDSTLTFCLCGCDASTDPNCRATAPTGADSINGATFGPPLPLIAGGVPVCVVNRFSGPAHGASNVQTGEMCGQINLLSDVYATDPIRVCPRCTNGTCDSGARRGQSCTVDGSVRVEQSLAANKDFQLSKSCPPLGTPLSTLTIGLPITTGTTGTPGTGGSRPCREREAQGVPAKDNNCSTGCVQGNCAGNACVRRMPDPSDPSQMICVDAKGGLSQACCNDDPTTPCFDTGPNGIGIIRKGRPVVAEPAWPDPTYPKTAEGVVTAATFCEAATGASNVDTVSGLPGPGAVIFNNRVEWQKLP